ncbi:MAG: hypothetical protein NC416_06660 [Eubacterium sp.]|nr:hypothetical protein [Eubacterium sp.]
MKIRNLLIITAMVLITVATGCGGQDTKQKANYVIPVEEITDEIEQDNHSPEIAKKDTDSSLKDTITDLDEENKDQADHIDNTNNTNNADNADNTNNTDNIDHVNRVDKIDQADHIINEIQRSDSKEHIGGKVRSIGQEDFVISRTLIDENGCVTMPEAGSPDEQLVTIRCTDTTLFEHWTIQSGGADIVTREASFSEITKGGGLEADGYFEGEEFIADKVMIEVYQ